MKTRKKQPSPNPSRPTKPRICKLGKRAPRFDLRTLRFANYRPAVLPVPPVEVSYVVKVPSWPMLLNDQLGSCVIAAMGHMVQQWTFFASGGTNMRTMTDAEALAAYEAIGGYDPNDPHTDQGCDMLTALNYWRNTGIMVGGELDKIGGFVAVDPTNLLEVRQAIWMFGNLFTGVQLPVAVQGADDWTVPDGGIYSSSGQPGSWGGHCIPNMAESPETLSCITWAERLKMSHNFLLDYADEAYAVLSADWFNAQGDAPPGFDLAALKKDIAAL
jgi:hypothetical protein